MLETMLPLVGIGGKGHHLRRMMAQAISSLEVNSTAYGGKHPSSVTFAAFLTAALAAVNSLVPVVDALMVFAPTAKTFSIASGTSQLGPVLTRSPRNLGAIVWTSSQPTIATINSSTGLVTPVAAGATTISAAAPAYGGYLATTKTYAATVAA